MQMLNNYLKLFNRLELAKNKSINNPTHVDPIHFEYEINYKFIEVNQFQSKDRIIKQKDVFTVEVYLKEISQFNETKNESSNDTVEKKRFIKFRNYFVQKIKKIMEDLKKELQSIVTNQENNYFVFMREKFEDYMKKWLNLLIFVETQIDPKKFKGKEITLFNVFPRFIIPRKPKTYHQPNENNNMVPPNIYNLQISMKKFKKEEDIFTKNTDEIDNFYAKYVETNPEIIKEYRKIMAFISNLNYVDAFKGVISLGDDILERTNFQKDNEVHVLLSICVVSRYLFELLVTEYHSVFYRKYWVYERNCDKLLKMEINKNFKKLFPNTFEDEDFKKAVELIKKIDFCYCPIDVIKIIYEVVKSIVAKGVGLIEADVIIDSLCYPIAAAKPRSLHVHIHFLIEMCNNNSLNDSAKILNFIAAASFLENMVI